MKRIPAKFNKIIAADCETTGMCFNSDSPVFNPKTNERHQAVSWGFVIADTDTLKPIDELYLEIKWNQHSIAAKKRGKSFGVKAESIHGLTYEYLKENGVSEEDAVVQIGELILKYFKPDRSLNLLGHNVISFDLWFLRDLFQRYNIPFKFSHRHVDTNSLGFGTFNTYTSDQLFENCGFSARDAHNALEDAKMSLASARVIRKIFSLGLEAI